MTSSPHDPAGSAAAPRSARFRAVLLVALVVLLLCSAGAVVWLLAARGGDAEDRQGQRDAVMSQARQFMLRSYTYGPDDLDEAGRLAENRAQVEEVVSDKFGAAYEESIAAIEQLVKSQGVGQSAQVHGVGVQYLDGDSARALVAGESTFTQRAEDGSTQDVQTQTFRMVVDLVKVDGAWLVDDSNIASAASPDAEPSGSPADTPALSPTPSPTDGAGR
ncbi:hypothetical protein [Nocardioides sp. W7]|uniref:hypothetical protein n=1 Tax=Nocardioides sp. W7 TaxID=2931390 RepID=UPI001FD4FE89|nr:hypothetical protein [Nocardioides sp. W7]